MPTPLAQVLVVHEYTPDGGLVDVHLATTPEQAAQMLSDVTAKRTEDRRAYTGVIVAYEPVQAPQPPTAPST